MSNDAIEAMGDSVSYAAVRRLMAAVLYQASTDMGIMMEHPKRDTVINCGWNLRREEVESFINSDECEKMCTFLGRTHNQFLKVALSGQRKQRCVFSGTYITHDKG